MPESLAVAVHRAANRCQLLAPLVQPRDHSLKVSGGDIELAHDLSVDDVVNLEGSNLSSGFIAYDA